jgi:transposase InsO family protein
MKQFNINRGVKGSRTIQERAIRFAYMVQDTAKRRARALTFWQRHGDKATEDAFNVSVRTLYRWQAALDKADGRLEALNPKSRRPKTIQRRIIPETVERAILEQRTEHPRMGKDMMTPILKAEYNLDLSVSYVGRCITTLTERGLIKDPPLKRYDHTKRKPKLRRKEKTGYELDTVIRFVDGVKTYILTAIHIETRFTFSFAYRSHSSRAAADFLRKLRLVSPVPVTHLQTDNGSEFAKEFEEACRFLNITHFHTYVRSPKMNAYIERFNRTVSEEFLVYHRSLMRDNLPAFNDALVDYLLWYNTRRPHSSLEYVPPLRYYVSTLSARDCQMLWTSTNA